MAAGSSDDDADVDFEDDLRAAIDGLSVRSQRKEIRKELTDPYNRLHSIEADIAYVRSTAADFPEFAVLANLRCGLWYVDPDGPNTVSEDVYFKSMDGHYGEWAFNLRRPNLGLLSVIIEHGRCIVVDSTRRGKRYPDALSKTVPIWCAVINRAVRIRYPDAPGWGADELDVHTPSKSVGSSERAQIRDRLEQFAADLAASSYELPALPKPLKPFHLNPSSCVTSQAKQAIFDSHCFPVICLSASRCTSGGSAERLGSFNYVPGSGDDHEGWAPTGFTPAMFWRNKDHILAASRAELRGVLQSIVQQEGQEISSGEKGTGPDRDTFRIGKTSIFVALHELAESETSCAIVLQGTVPANTAENTSTNSVYVPPGTKRHFSAFTERIGDIARFASECLSNGTQIRISMQQNTGNNRDFATGIVLVLLSMHYGDNQEPLPEGSVSTGSKQSILRRLEWVIASSNGALNPSRGILKRVNEHILSR